MSHIWYGFYKITVVLQHNFGGLLMGHLFGDHQSPIVSASGFFLLTFATLAFKSALN